jgi:hypothetical protein
MKKLASVLSFLGAITLGASAATLFSDNFNSYADGALVTVSGGVWANHSGTLGQVDVASGAVNLTENESEDVNALIAANPFSTGVLYYAMDIDFTALPSFAAGGYFAHFKDSTTGFRARLFATTTEAAPGTYRLGINNGSTPVSVSFPVDLTLNSTHRAVVRYDLDSALTTLWVDPSSQDSANVTATDIVTQNQVAGIALRQSKTSNSGMGTLTVDNLVVGTAFADMVAIPEPTGLLTLGLLSVAGTRALRRRG